MYEQIKKIIGGMLAAVVLSAIKLANAASLTDNDTLISQPVGKGILPGGGAEGADIKSSILFVKIIPFAISWAINLAIGLSVIVVIIGGYQYLTAYGDEEKRQRGTRSLIYAFTGLIIALTAYGIVTVITSIQLS